MQIWGRKEQEEKAGLGAGLGVGGWERRAEANACRGLLPQPTGPGPSGDPRLSRLSANRLMTLWRPASPAVCPQTQGGFGA